MALGQSRSMHRRVRSAMSWLERQALFVAGLATVAGVILAKVPSHINQDGWLALLDGRYVAQHGIPHADTLAVLTHGARWIDQQWLAQLAIYGLHQLGGLPLYSIVYVALTVGSFGIAIVAARRLGGSEAHVIWVLPVAFLYFAGSVEIRTQGFAYPLFVGTLWLLSSEIRVPGRRRVYWVFPLLILWANLHGSASLGAGLAALYGVSLLVEDLRSGRPWHVRGRGLAFVIGAPLCLLVTPYGISGLTYYRETLLNPAFKTLVVEWQPVTAFAVLAIPFFVAAFATVWVLGYTRGRARLFEALTLLALIAAAVAAVRNITWFALALIMLLPSTLGTVVAARPAAPRRRRLNLAMVGASAILLLAALVTVATKPSSWFERGYDPRALAQVAAVVHRQPGVRIYAAGHFADWLVWHDPSLAGHIAYDSRLELLTGKQLRELADLTEIRAPGAHNILTGYGLLVLETPGRTSQLLLDQPGTHVIVRGHGVAVATRSTD
jgi:MFS family permease